MATGNKKKFEITLGKTGILIIVAGMTGLLCAAFLFGVDMGKNMDTYPEKIAGLPYKALALVWRPAKMKVARDVQSGQKTYSVLNEEEMDLTFHDTLTRRKDMKVNAIAPSEKPVPSPPPEEVRRRPENDIPKEPLPAVVKHTDNAKKVTQGNEKASTEGPDRKSFYVQAAALKEKEKALKISRNISSLGFPSDVVRAEIEGKGVVFRVIVPGFADREQADQAAKLIFKKTGKKCIVKKNGEM